VIFRILALFAVSLAVNSAFGADWVKIPNCTLVQDSYRDGDSFHVTTGDKDYIFRLYFVDCPETDNRFPDRVAEQAGYFGVSSAAALLVGEQAKAFTARALTKPFTVYTKFQDARGSSSQHRFYALVETGSGPLASQLVSHGLARVFGMPTALADGTKAKTYIAGLKDLEARAKAAKLGAWGGRPVGAAAVDEEAPAGKDLPAF
jgi:endonuclease YncB( thermonuclease family)